MMKMKRLLLCLLVGLGVGTADAAIILDQDFDDTGTFSPGITGFVGDAANTGGRWGPFDTTYTRISNTVSLSGAQSAIVTRGSTLEAWVDAVVTTSEFDVSYSLYRATADSWIIVQVGNSGSISGALDLALEIQENGTVWHWNGAGWSQTAAANVPVGQWVDYRLAVNATAMTYDLFVGGAFVQTINLTALPANINAIRFNPQVLAGNETYADDVRIIEIPEPATAGLLGMGGLFLLHRRRCG